MIEPSCLRFGGRQTRHTGLLANTCTRIISGQRLYGLTNSNQRHSTHPNADGHASGPADGPAATSDSAAVRQRPVAYRRHRSSHPAAIVRSDGSALASWSHASDSVCPNRSHAATSTLGDNCGMKRKEIATNGLELELKLFAILRSYYKCITREHQHENVNMHSWTQILLDWVLRAYRVCAGSCLHLTL